MKNDPYIPPKAEINKLSELDDLPRRLTRNIKIGWIICLIIGVLNTIEGISSIILEGEIYLLLQAFLILAMGFGLYKRSRFAGTVIFLFYLFLQYEIFFGMFEYKGLEKVTVLVVLYFFFQAMIATYLHHAYIKRNSENLVN